MNAEEGSIAVPLLNHIRREAILYMAFNSYEFSFAGESSYQYGLMLYDFDGSGQSNVNFGNQANIVEARISRRIQPLHFGVNYHQKPLEFKLVFGAEEPLDRYELESISMWLTGHQDYQWLSIDQPDLELVQFHCLITQLTPIHHGWLPYAFEAMVVCDCPYAYGFPFEYQYSISGATDILFRNVSSVREYIKPTLVYATASGGTLSIVNHNDNDREFKLTGIPASSNVVVDNRNGIIQETIGETNLYDGFNLNFFRLVHGDNDLTVTGNGTLTITGRMLYNVAG